MSGKADTTEALLLDLIRLTRAEFDMRCAAALTWDLEGHDDSIDARAFGLFTGLAVSYARPFVPGKRNPYGELKKPWSQFPGRADFAEHHRLLIDARNTLLAHNDLTPHRTPLVLLKWLGDKPAVTEQRTAIQAAGIPITRELCTFQQTRFSTRAREIAEELQKSLGWTGAEVNVDDELARVRQLSR